MDEIGLHLLSTKLFVPASHQALVARENLLARFDDCLARPLTLVCAPAGYGKTTLVTSWISLQRERAPADRDALHPFFKHAWISLDTEDDDPIRLIRYLITAMEGISPGLFDNVHPYLNSFPSPPLASVLTLIINQLCALQSPVILILDDYQFITKKAIHEVVAYLIEHLPELLHLVIITRSDPPFPLARMRARNQLLEFRAEDLRFSISEAATLFNSIMQLPLTDEHIAKLDQRTEGWIAGLQMAAIALQNQQQRGNSDRDQFIESFSGSHRYILDFLTEEILNRQSPEVADFLISTSVLERFCAPLCHAILPDHSLNAQKILDYLEQSNLFIIRLDEERIWFRYHHLFADLLRARLKQLTSDSVLLLHQRASHWCAEHGLINEAIHHANQARDWDLTTQLVEQNLQRFLEKGLLSTILKWVDGLPQRQIQQRPALCIGVAEALAHAGQLDKMEPFLRAAETFVATYGKTEPHETQELTNEEAVRIWASAAMLRSMLFIVSGKSARGLALAEAALTGGTLLAPRESAWLSWVAGFACRNLGRLTESHAYFLEATRLATEAKITLRDFWTDLAITKYLLGDLTRAVEILEESIRIAAERGNLHQGNLSRDEAYLSGILLEQNRLDDALLHAQNAVSYTRWWPGHNHIATANAFLARVLFARGELDEAAESVSIADQERRLGLVTPDAQSVADRIVDRSLVRIWLAQGNQSALSAWEATAKRFLPADWSDAQPLDEIREIQLVLLARSWVDRAANAPSEDLIQHATQLLTYLEDSTRTSGRMTILIEVLVLKGILLHREKKTKEALHVLDESLRTAEPGGYVRTFLDMGEDMRALLAEYLHETRSGSAAYAKLLLTQFSSLSEKAGVYTAEKVGLDALTAREKDVLRLMAAGDSNRRIAEKLFLAEGTVKFHVHSILDKLQVHSRTQAIVVAKERQLID